MLGFKIAECPECGQRYFADDEETVRRKFSKHRCVQYWTDKEVWEKVEQILQSRQADKAKEVDIHGKGEVSAAGEGWGTTAKIPKPQAPIKAPSLPPKMRAMVTITRRFVGPSESGE